jgi:hypothetical protein
MKLKSGNYLEYMEHTIDGVLFNIVKVNTANMNYEALKEISTQFNKGYVALWDEINKPLTHKDLEWFGLPESKIVWKSKIIQ